MPLDATEVFGCNPVARAKLRDFAEHPFGGVPIAGSIERDRCLRLLYEKE